MSNISKLLRLNSVTNIRECSRAKIYQDIQDEVFCPPVKDGVSSFWIENEVHACNEAVIAGLTDEEMREFVRELVRSRISKNDLKSKYLQTKINDNPLHPAPNVLRGE
ncbi:hypothetical protein [uncultured Methylophaga sp.]|uniref:helix-turn-helix transcriptional regulator n=1 Tax=uncultured Methylophaga sp. TaxID=285271 RepID=UPI00261B71EC|nr:hypothetical protein [uncultured Methylophaga sp.]